MEKDFVTAMEFQNMFNALESDCAGSPILSETLDRIYPALTDGNTSRIEDILSEIWRWDVTPANEPDFEYFSERVHELLHIVHDEILMA